METKTKKQMIEEIMEMHPYIKKSGLTWQKKEELEEFFVYSKKMENQGRNK